MQVLPVAASTSNSHVARVPPPQNYTSLLPWRSFIVFARRRRSRRCRRRPPVFAVAKETRKQIARTPQTRAINIIIIRTEVARRRSVHGTFSGTKRNEHDRENSLKISQRKKLKYFCFPKTRFSFFFNQCTYKTVLNTVVALSTCWRINNNGSC